jgi:hypothetical protein
VVIDVVTRRVISFGVGGGEYIDGPAVCRMLNQGVAVCEFRLKRRTKAGTLKNTDFNGCVTTCAAMFDNSD